MPGSRARLEPQSGKKSALRNRLALLWYSYADGAFTLEFMILISQKNFYRAVKRVY
jgi:hypothetical protein